MGQLEAATYYYQARERDQARSAGEDLRTKLEGTEDSLNQALAELETTKTDLKNARDQGYNEGVDATTEN